MLAAFPWGKRWKNFTKSGVCRLTFSNRSTASRRAARADGADIIDLGMGNPDLPTPQHDRRQARARSFGNPRTAPLFRLQGHSPACAGPRPAITRRRFGVKLNPDTQVVATLGSKEGFANMAQAITAPGDVILVPEPDLSDPCLRLPDGGRCHPFDPGRAGPQNFFAAAGARRAPIRSRSR